MLRNVGVNRHHENPTVLVDTNSLRARDRKSTRLNSSHDQISYAVFCLKKKKKTPLRRYWLTIQKRLVNHAKHTTTFLPRYQQPLPTRIALPANHTLPTLYVDTGLRSS